MKVLIVDDQAIVRQGLAALLADSGMADQVLQAASAAEGLALAAASVDLDAVMLDLQLAGEDGMAAIPAFGDLRPETPVIILSSSEDPADVRRALELGALGYVPKSANSDALRAAIAMVLAGGVYVPEFVRDSRAAPGPLTPRQREVLAAMAAGLSNKQIGRRFGLSEKTVKVHVGAILRALGVANRTQAAREAQRLGVRAQP